MKTTLVEERKVRARRFPWLGVAVPLSLLLGFITYPYLNQRMLWPSTRVTPDPASHPYKHDYRFTTDWFSGRIPVWASALKGYQGKPDVQYLEIGTWEGRSLLWMIDNILTDPTSRATGIDPLPIINDPFHFPQTSDIKSTLFSNIRLSGQADRIRMIIGYSQIELRKLPLGSYDIIYIDGSHESDDTLEDIVLSSRLLKPGGLMIMDDYDRNWFFEGYKQFFDRPEFAMDSFYAAFRNKFDVIHRGYQIILRKKP
jgi:hypothetical protein